MTEIPITCNLCGGDLWRFDGEQMVCVGCEETRMTHCGRCRDCNHWRRYMESTGECIISEKNEGMMWAPSYPLAVVTDRNFGCVQFEAKKASDDR